MLVVVVAVVVVVVVVGGGWWLVVVVDSPEPFCPRRVRCVCLLQPQVLRAMSGAPLKRSHAEIFEDHAEHPAEQAE